MSKQNEGQASVAKQIESQLAEGRRLLDLQIRTERDLERAAAQRSIWVEKNVAILYSASLPEPNRTKLLNQASLDNTSTGEDFAAEVDAFHDITKAQMNVLENALTLVPKDQVLDKSVRNDGGESLQRPSTPEAGLSIKDRIERHPLGVAAIISTACITITLLVMSWYHAEVKEALTNKYETQIIGLKNEMEAQRRKYEETISKLQDQLETAQPHSKSQAPNRH